MEVKKYPQPELKNKKIDFFSLASAPRLTCNAPANNKKLNIPLSKSDLKSALTIMSQKNL